MFGVECVPIPLISVRCENLFGDVEVRGPGSEGAASMSLPSLFSTDIDLALHETVMKASNGRELLDEACRMVVDELDRLSAQPRR